MNCQDLAHWYFRLNGCLTVANFIIHPLHAGPQRTEVDIVGVRFPYRHEFDDPEAYDSPFKEADRTLFLIAEVKRGRCDLNPPLRVEKNISYVLKSLSPVNADRLAVASSDWANSGAHSGPDLSCRFMCFGERRSDTLEGSICQKTWDEVLHFVHRRFSYFFRVKRDNEQWDSMGRALWRQWQQSRENNATFAKSVKKELGLGAGSE